MRQVCSGFLILLLAATAPAHAGSTVAGPAGNGATLVGTVASSDSMDVSLGKGGLSPAEARLAGVDVGELAPGLVAVLSVSAAQAAYLAEAVSQLPGARSEGTVVAAPYVLRDGTRGVLVVDASRSRAVFVRDEG